MQKLSPRDLFARCAATPNDEAAWQEFLRRYRPSILSAIHRILGHPPAGRHAHLFQDALQRFHLRLLENDRRALHRFSGESESTAQAYLRKIAAGVALKMLPRKGVFQLPLEALAEETGRFRGPVFPEPAGAPEDYLTLLHDLDAGLEKILRGRKRYRNLLIFKLAFFYGFSPDDIVRVLGLKINSCHAIEQLTHRTRAKLAHHLRARDGA